MQSSTCARQQTRIRSATVSRPSSAQVYAPGDDEGSTPPWQADGSAHIATRVVAAPATIRERRMHVG